MLTKAGECGETTKTCVEEAFGEWASVEKQAELEDLAKTAKHDCLME